LRDVFTGIALDHTNLENLGWLIILIGLIPFSALDQSLHCFISPKAVSPFGFNPAPTAGAS